jgi:hypothetical protein
MRTGPRVLALCMVAGSLMVTPPLFAQGKGNDKAQHSNAKGGKQNDKGPQQKPEKAQSQSRGNSDKPGHAAKENRGGGNDKADANHGRGNDRAKDNRGRGNGGGNYSTDDHRTANNPIAAAADKSRGNSKTYRRVIQVNELKPALKRYAASNRAPERIAAGALARAYARGLGDDQVIIRPNGDRVALLNRSGIVLVNLDDNARNLGGWRVTPYDDDVKSGAPAFCRSGAGHPVWGREWCFDKGFGIGNDRDWRWGRTTDVGDIIFRQEPNRADLVRDALVGVLGDVVFNRLGLHAVTLGYSEPLTGVWLGEPSGPRVLRLSSGVTPIAEIYDADRDNRADALVVALRAW